MKTRWKGLWCLCAMAILHAAPAAEERNISPIVVTIELCDVSGQARNEFRRGEPIWATLKLRNVGRDRLMVHVPASPAMYVDVEAIGAGGIGENREAYFAPTMLMIAESLEPHGRAYAASILVNDYVSFHASGEQDIRVRLKTTPAVPAGQARVTINGTLSDDARSSLLRHMYAAWIRSERSAR